MPEEIGVIAVRDVAVAARVATLDAAADSAAVADLADLPEALVEVDSEVLLAAVLPSVAAVLVALPVALAAADSEVVVLAAVVLAGLPADLGVDLVAAEVIAAAGSVP